MSDATLTHKDLAVKLGVSETTVKSYRRKFPGCIPVASKGKPIRFPESALTVATRIRDLFETGMSVEEVRARLATEFDWISPENPDGRADEKEGKERSAAPELAIGVSNMAKSLVALTQQQKTMLGRMQTIEGMLEELGLSGGAAVEGAATAKTEKQSVVEARLERLDQNTRELGGIVRNLAEELARFLGRREKAAEEWNGQSEATLAEAARLAQETVTRQNAQSAPKENGQGGARVIPLRPQPERPQSDLVPGANAVMAESSASEPPRTFLALPMVVRTEQGQFESAVGRNKGRFSVNDLKAMLSYGHMPPNHFTQRWERHGRGWWLFLEQENSEQNIHLLLMELPTQRGISVVEILQIKRDGEARHPAEIRAVIDALSVKE